MDKIKVQDTLSHTWAKVQFLNETLGAEHEAPLSERARLGLQDFFCDIQNDIDVVSKEVESLKQEPSIKEAIEHAKRKGIA